VTKEKLKMNWHIKGKPSDSDQLAAWLAKEQGVPQDVVATVYQKMNIPLAAPATTATQPAAGAPATTATQPAAGAPATTATQPAAGAPATTATQPPSYNAANVTNMPGMAQNAKPKPANFASPSSYGQTTMSVKAPAAATAPAQAAPAAAADHQPQVGGKIYDAIKRNLAAIDNEEKQDIVSLLQSSSAPAAVTEQKKYQAKLDAAAAVQKESKKKITAKDDPCWSGYHMVGTKKKGNREVPNCVPGKKGA
jgi:DNA polymerase-3 subunit gamma/tau